MVRVEHAEGFNASDTQGKFADRIQKLRSHPCIRVHATVCVVLMDGDVNYQHGLCRLACKHDDARKTRNPFPVIKREQALYLAKGANLEAKVHAALYSLGNTVALNGGHQGNPDLILLRVEKYDSFKLWPVRNRQS